MSELTSLQFTQKLSDSVKEYRKQLAATRDDQDAAVYFNLTLKHFLKTHEKEMNLLANLSFEKSFMTWMKNYLLKL